MENKEKCTCIGCNIDRDEGDSLFCLTHRIRWKEYCKKQGIENIILPTEDEKLALNEFKNI